MTPIDLFVKKLIDHGFSYAQIYQKIVQHAAEVNVELMRNNFANLDELFHIQHEAALRLLAEG